MVGRAGTSLSKCQCVCVLCYERVKCFQWFRVVVHLSLYAADLWVVCALNQADFDAPVVHGRKTKIGPSQEKNILFIGNLSFDTTWVEFLNALAAVAGAENIAAFELKVKDDGMWLVASLPTYLLPGAIPHPRANKQTDTLRIPFDFCCLFRRRVYRALL